MLSLAPLPRLRSYMPIAINSLQTTPLSPTNDALLARVADVETRLAALEAIITCPPGGGVTIVSPTSLRLVAGTNYLITVGSDMTVSVANSSTLSTGRQVMVVAGDQITLTTGLASLTTKRMGDVDLTGS